MTYQAAIQIEEEVLASLQEKAFRKSDEIGGAVGTKLRRNAQLEPTWDDFLPEGDVRNGLTPDERLEPGSHEASVLIAQMKRQRQNLWNLYKVADPHLAALAQSSDI